MKSQITMKKSVVLTGTTPIMFDRYSGNNKTELRPLEKVYTDEEGYLVLPSLNILSFLSATNTESAPKRVIGRGYKEVAKAALSFVTIEPFNIPFLVNGKKITLETADIDIHFAVARVMKGSLAVPNPKERPLLNLPWDLEFQISLIETPELGEQLLQKLFEIGGLAIGFGTFRGVFGKFKIVKWDNVK